MTAAPPPSTSLPAAGDGAARRRGGQPGNGNCNRGYASRLASRNLVVDGRRTTMRLEPEMWQAVGHLARQAGQTVSEFCAAADRLIPTGSLTGKVRSATVTALLATQPGLRA